MRIAMLMSLATVVATLPYFCGVCPQVRADWPAADWEQATPGEVGMDATQLDRARQYALTGDGSGIITRHGKVVMTWGDVSKLYDLKSTTKSFGATALGVALKDNKVQLSSLAVELHSDFGVPPDTNCQHGWLNQITLLHLATQTAGFEKPGGYTKLLFEPGTKWDYSDSGPNWLAECLTLTYQRDLQEWMFERVFTPIGISRDDLRWRRNQYRPRQIRGIERREFGSGIHANVDAMARLGYLYLRNGVWQRQPILAKEFVEMASRTHATVVGLPEHNAKDYGNASDHYGLLWWNNADGTLPDVPHDAFWSWGLYDSLILVIPSLDIVVARAGKSWKRTGSGHYQPLKSFVTPIATAAHKPSLSTRDDGDVAAETEPLIQAIRWAPADSVIRQATGSDNWPLTWGDDDALYAAYGDGHGFDPKVNKKLSLGLARIVGTPADFRGINIRSASGEHLGDGAAGRKASGMLMVDGVLYMWSRNVGNSQIGWSADRGKTWTWAKWQFTKSFAAPTFLNYGKNYQNALDQYVYIYSFDSDSAYQAADRMVLARVPKDRIRDRAAYEFFRSRENNTAVWTSDLDGRGAVFAEPHGCYRSHVSYNGGIRRFLWVQIKGTDDTRFRGGLAVYEATAPWGPWLEVYRADTWDMGPGESASLPTKWMSDDGLTLFLVFSGNDSFSVRKATLVVRQ